MLEETLETRDRILHHHSINRRERSDQLRERVRDEVLRSGGRAGKERYEDAKRDFVRCAIKQGTLYDLKLWSDREDRERNGMMSLNYLLQEQRAWNPQAKAFYSGNNEHWVLDLWELALEKRSREPIYTTPEEKKRRDAEAAADELVAREQEDEEPEEGVQVFAKPAPKGVGMKIIEAYLKGDEGSILQHAASTGLGMGLVRAYIEHDEDAILAMAGEVER